MVLTIDTEIDSILTLNCKLFLAPSGLYFSVEGAMLSQLTACNMYGQGTLTLVSTKHQSGLHHVVSQRFKT